MIPNEILSITNADAEFVRSAWNWTKSNSMFILIVLGLSIGFLIILGFIYAEVSRRCLCNCMCPRCNSNSSNDGNQNLTHILVDRKLNGQFSDFELQDMKASEFLNTVKTDTKINKSKRRSRLLTS